MKLRTKNILRETARHLGLKVKFVNYFSDDVHGKLLNREKRILINANKPRCEHVYTLLHEFGHFVLHCTKRAPQKYYPWFLKHNWKITAIADFVSKVRRTIRFAFSTNRGKEWEADLWAMCAFAYFKRFVGHSDLTAFLNRHPDKRGIYRLAATVVVYCDIKKRIATAFKFLGSVRHGLSVQPS
jgi:hypothetical protein